MSKAPYIVLLGDAGAGKSTLFEKLTERAGRSSATSESFTREPEILESSDGRLLICDTPGTNSSQEKFKSNLYIAQAMNFWPVTSILVVVKADMKIDNVIGKISEYVTRFVPEDLPIGLVSVCITHMDLVSWGKEDLIPHIYSHLGLDTVLPVSLQTTRQELEDKLHSVCRKKRPVKLDINSDMFLSLFKLNNNNLKVLCDSKKEVVRFDKIKQEFYRQRASYSDRDQMDMIFEFQAWMASEITLAQERVSTRNGFQFINGPYISQEAGHLASMTNQLRAILYDIRIEAAKYHKDMDTTFRKCPKCGLIWQKGEGCDGETLCGSRPTSSIDARKDVFGKMNTFFFEWVNESNFLKINRISNSSRHASVDTKPQGQGKGCGTRIVWAEMTPVAVPAEFEGDIASTKGMRSLPARLWKTWRDVYHTAYHMLPKLTWKTVPRPGAAASCVGISEAFDVSVFDSCKHTSQCHISLALEPVCE